MAKRKLLVPAVSAALLIYSGLGLSADQQGMQENSQARQQVTGRELMTEHERAEHHARMKAANTPEEREQLRRQQHAQMKMRAEERGLNIPDKPPARDQRTHDYAGQGGGGHGR